MRKQAVYALVLMAVAVLVLILNKDNSVNLNVLVSELRRVSASLVFFGWMALGVIIGVLLK